MVEAKYEFDAPLYIDFEDVMNGVESEGMDQWFLSHSHLEQDNITPVGSEASGAPPPVVKQEQPDEGAGSDAPCQPATTAAANIKRERESEVEKEEEDCSETRAPVKLGQKRNAVIASLQTPVTKQPRVQRKKSRRNSSKKAATAIREILKPSHKHAAKTPEHLRRYLAKKQGEVKKTREELEVEEMEKMQAESRKKLHEHRRSFHRLAANSGQKPAKRAKYTKPTTEAVEFKFRTDKRCRQRRSACVSSRPPPSSSSSSSYSHISKFPMTLRSGSTNCSLQTESEGPRKVTEAKPFNFHLDSRFRKGTTTETAPAPGEKNDFVSMAEFVFKFQARAPERFRELPRKTHYSVPSSVDETSQSSSSTSSSRAGLTVPYTPKLMTKTRARPVVAKSSAEIEEEEMARIQKNPIKAQPLNLKVFTKNGLMGLPKKPHYPVTEAHTPKLATRERGEARAHSASEGGDSDHESQASLFKAQPLPKGLFDKVMGLPEKQEAPITCPKSPAFALRRRDLHPSTTEEKEEEKCQVTVARPMPDFSQKFEPQLEHKKTQPEPFGFEDRYKDKPTRATLVQQILEKEKRQPFRANPVPNFDDPPFPVARSTEPVTEPKTPTLQTQIRGQKYETKWKQTLSEMAQKEKENAEFRARDPKVLYQPPFRVETGSCPIAEVSNVILHTDVRSKLRAEFDKQCQSKEEQREQENQERLRAAEVEESRRVARLRQSMVHKAQPVRRYTRTVIHPCMKPLTAPRSPNFCLSSRATH